MTKLTKDRIDEIFVQARHQVDYVVGLYCEIFPRWEQIDKINGHPKVSHDTGDYINKKTMAFDRQHHPDVLPGGLWMNKGFSTMGSQDVPDWSVQTDHLDIHYKDQS